MPRYELKYDTHYVVNRLNLSFKSDYLGLRAIIRQPIRTWLRQHNFPHSITINHIESSDPDIRRYTTKWLMSFERRVECFIEFDDPGHLLLFKLTWG